MAHILRFNLYLQGSLYEWFEKLAEGLPEFIEKGPFKLYVEYSVEWGENGVTFTPSVDYNKHGQAAHPMTAGMALQIIGAKPTFVPFPKPVSYCDGAVWENDGWDGYEEYLATWPAFTSETYPCPRCGQAPIIDYCTNCKWSKN